MWAEEELPGDAQESEETQEPKDNELGDNHKQLPRSLCGKKNPNTSKRSCIIDASAFIRKWCLQTGSTRPEIIADTARNWDPADRACAWAQKDGRNRRYGLNRIMSKLEETSETEAVLNILDMNAAHKLRR